MRALQANFQKTAQDATSISSASDAIATDVATLQSDVAALEGNKHFGARIYMTSNHDVSGPNTYSHLGSAGWTETFDTSPGGNLHDSGNERFYIPVTGYYRFRLSVYWTIPGSNVSVACYMHATTSTSAPAAAASGVAAGSTAGMVCSDHNFVQTTQFYSPHIQADGTVQLDSGMYVYPMVQWTYGGGATVYRATGGNGWVTWAEAHFLGDA
jgi:hypothetical protein